MATVEIIVYPENKLIEWIEYLISDGGSIEDYKDSVIAKAKELDLTPEEAIALLEHKWRSANDLEYYLRSDGNSGYRNTDRVIEKFSTKDKKEFINYIKYCKVSSYWNNDYTADVKKKMDDSFKNCPEVQQAFKPMLDAEKKANRKNIFGIILTILITLSLAKCLGRI